MSSRKLSLGKLRPIKVEELEMMLSWRNATNVRKNMYTGHEISISEHIEWWDKTQKKTDQLYFMYEFQGEPCGILYFTGIDKVHKNAFWGFYAAPKAPKGTGSKMEYLALEYFFNDIALNKLCCEVLESNIPVINLHKKFGFNIEGVLRKQKIIDGKYVDVYFLGILAHEWIAHRDLMLEKVSKIS